MEQSIVVMMPIDEYNEMRHQIEDLLKFKSFVDQLAWVEKGVHGAARKYAPGFQDLKEVCNKARELFGLQKL